MAEQLAQKVLFRHNFEVHQRNDHAKSSSSERRVYSAGRVTQQRPPSPVRVCAPAHVPKKAKAQELEEDEGSCCLDLRVVIQCLGLLLDVHPLYLNIPTASC